MEKQAGRGKVGFMPSFFQLAAHAEVTLNGFQHPDLRSPEKTGKIFERRVCMST
jgi:hypothetical protein